MKTLYIITAIVFCAASLHAAQLYYQFSDAQRLNNTDRVLIYQNSSGNRNITGAMLRSEILAGNAASATTAGAMASPYGNYSTTVPIYTSTATSSILDHYSTARTHGSQVFFVGPKLVIRTIP